jgi:uncharacterized membrane protein
MRISDRQFIIAGWLLFTLSALGFIWSSLESGDVASLIGGVLFLLACVFFMIPYIRGSM